MKPRVSHILFMCLVLGLVPAVLHADSFGSLMGYPYKVSSGPGFDYAWEEAEGTQVIYARVQNIVYPVLGMPALVEPGGKIGMIVKYENPTYVDKVTDWRVELSTSISVGADRVGDPVEQRYTLWVDTVVYDDEIEAYRVNLLVPEEVPRDTYHLLVTTHKFSDLQPNAVGVRTAGDSFRILNIADPQASDPTAGHNAISTDEYPEYNPDKEPRGMILQQLQTELPFWDADLVMLSGDLIFGTRPTQENDWFHDALQGSRSPIFLTPGNHDGYAFWKGKRLRSDGLEFFERYFGPLYYSFDYGDFHFVAVNSYDGSPNRRAARPILGLAPAVDNWGGTLSEEQLAWLEEDLAYAAAAGKSIVVFMHHDPRGPFTPNDPPGTQSFTFGQHEEWNYDSSDWDSNPFDGIENETPEENTGTRVVRIFLDHQVRWVFLGHTHGDFVDSFETGEGLTDYTGAPLGVVAEAPVDFVHTTTMAAGPMTDEDYWGYRLIQVEGGEITDVDFTSRYQSIPGGNVVVLESGNLGTGDQASIRVTNSLPKEIRGTITFYMAAGAKGYRITDAEGTEIPITQVGTGEDGEVVLYAQVTIPAGSDEESFPDTEGVEKIFTARPREDNSAPTGSIRVVKLNEELYSFQVEGESDADGDAIVRHDWIITDGSHLSGPDVLFRHISLLPETITLYIVDEHGARGVATAQIDIDRDEDEDDDEDDEGCGGCGVASSGEDIPGFSGAFFLLIAALVTSFRRYSRSSVPSSK